MKKHTCLFCGKKTNNIKNNVAICKKCVAFKKPGKNQMSLLLTKNNL